MAESQPRRRLRVLAVFGGIVLALGAAELVLRITHWGTYSPRTNDYHFLFRDGDGYWFGDPARPPEHVWDGDPFGRLPPGARMTYPLNSHGLRGPETDPNHLTALCVGDSFTFGEGVKYEDTFPARLGVLLARRFDAPPQIVSAGVPGYGTEQEAARLPGWLEEFKPRAVVVVFVPNDPIPLDDEVGRNDFVGTTGDAPTFYLGRLLSTALSRSASNREVEEWYESYYFGSRRDRWESTRRRFEEMKARTKAAGARFGLVIFPILYELNERPFAKIHATVNSACREIGVPVLDLTDALAVEPDRALWVHPTDHHPDARAHELAAKAMAPFVESLLR